MLRSLIRVAHLPPAALIVVLLCAASAPAAAPAHSTSALVPSVLRHSSTAMNCDGPEWIESFLKWLKELYRILGGDPNDLDSDLNTAMGQVASYYHAHGLPTGMTSAQVIEAQGVVEELESLLASPPYEFDPGTFPATLDEIESALNAME